MAVIVEKHTHPNGLVFVMHGLSGTKDQPHIQTFRSVFREKGYTVVSFDTTNTFGESDGDYADATTTNYYQDLEDVILWAKKQNWYHEPFCLIGHSLGGYCIAKYSEKNPQEIKGVAPISTVVTGKLTIQALGKSKMRAWEKSGWLVEESTGRPGLVERLRWSFAEDFPKHTLFPEVHHLTMPVLMIVGEKDSTTPVAHQKLLYEKLPGKKEFHIIKRAPHTFIDPKHLSEVKKIIKKWIESF